MARALALDPAKLGKELGQRGLKIYSELAACRRARTSLRALVRSGVTGASALRTVAVEVRAARPVTQLLAPVVPEPANKWINVPPTAPTQPALRIRSRSARRPVMPAAQPVLIDRRRCAALRVRLRGRRRRGGDQGRVARPRRSTPMRWPRRWSTARRPGRGSSACCSSFARPISRTATTALRVALGSGATLVESAPVNVAVLHRDAPQGAAP